jgi:hypothetical protein
VNGRLGQIMRRAELGVERVVEAASTRGCI